MIMDKKTLSSLQLLCFSLCFLHYILITRGTLTIEPTTACVGDRIQVDCSLTVPAAGDTFPSIDASYIVGNLDAPISAVIVNGDSISGGVSLTKLMAVSVFGNSTFLEGRLILLSYLTEDNNIRLGCGSEYLINGVSANRGALNETLNVIQAEPVILSTTSPDITFQINQDLVISPSINHSLASVERVDTLEYNFTLYYNSSSETLLTSNKSVNFLTKFTIGICYKISVSLTNCAGGEGESFTKYFVLPEFGTGQFKIGTFNFSRASLIFSQNSCPKADYEENYIPSSFFTFSLRNLDTNVVYNITEHSLYLPQGFDFYIPDNFYNAAGRFALRIDFLGTITDIPFTIEETQSNVVLIILIVLFVLLLVLLSTILAFIIIFVIIHFKRKRDSEK